MKPVYQTKVGPLGGNCFETAVASMLELTEIPDFGKDDNWYERLKELLKPFGLYPIDLEVKGCKDNWTPSGYYIVSGASPRGVLHSVVAYCGELVHDPNPNGHCEIEHEIYTLFVATLDPIEKGRS